VRDDRVVQFNALFNVHTHFASEAALVLGGLASIGCVRVYIVAKNAQTKILRYGVFSKIPLPPGFG
jgi:hypothetical protein